MSVKLAKPENPVETLVRSQMEELEEMVGGRHNLITGLLASDDHRANRLATALQKADNADKNIYDVCRSVNMSLEEALRCFSKGEIFKSTIETFLALSEGLPAVMQQSVEVAKSHGPDGYKDRELLFKLSGLLKDGGGINVNLNQKIYKPFYEFNDFQFVMVMPKGTEAKVEELKKDLGSLGDISKWKFIYGDPDEIKTMFASLKTDLTLEDNLSTPFVFIVDKDISLRGRKDDEGNGTKYGFNTSSVADLNNKMEDDVKIIFAEYRMALKKNNAERSN